VDLEHVRCIASEESSAECKIICDKKKQNSNSGNYLITITLLFAKTIRNVIIKSFEK
jgi:hypothetical protein